MKTKWTALAALTLCHVSGALACQDFSGKYVPVPDQGDKETLTITQNGCASWTILHSDLGQEGEPTEMVFDGVTRTLSSDQSTILTQKEFWNGDSAVDEVEIRSAKSRSSLLSRETFEYHLNGEMLTISDTVFDPSTVQSWVKSRQFQRTQ